MLLLLYAFFFFNDTATTEIYTLSLHDALPIWASGTRASTGCAPATGAPSGCGTRRWSFSMRSEEHTSELQSRPHLVCRLLLEKKKKDCQLHKTELSDVPFSIDNPPLSVERSAR